jgi:adenylate cyclase
MAHVLSRKFRGFFLPERGVLRAAPYAVVVGAALALAVALAFTGTLQRVEWSVYDAFMRQRARQAEPAPQVVVVAIDDPSMAEIDLPWPWPRALHAQLVEAIASQQPASIAFDMIFDLPGTSEEGNAALAEAIDRAGNVVVGSDLAPTSDRHYSLVQWVDPLPQFAAAAARVAVVRIPIDPDGAIRRASLEIEGRPSLAAAAVGRMAAADPDLRLFRYSGPSRRGILTASYYQALDATHSLPPGFFTGKHVFIGMAVSAAVGLQADSFRTPVDLQMPGVEVHATIADAILRDRFLRDPIDSVPRLTILCVLLAAVAAAVTYRLQPGPSFAAALAACLLVFAVGYVAFAYGGTRLPVVAPLTAIAASYAAGAAYRFTLANRERRLIKRAFKNFVAPAIVDEMLNDPSKLKLGGETYQVTVLFSDIEGFSTLAERLTPQELTGHLTRYFRDMLNCLLAERATLDKLIGDAIMVYFGCPVPDARHPEQACRGALAMQRRMTELNAQWAREGLPSLRTRIGINTGEVVAGNMGTETIFNYTVLGDTVNLASRLEGVNKEYGTLVIVGEDTWARVSAQFEARELDWIRVKGKQEPVAIYELISEAGALDPRRRELLARYAAGLHTYRAGRWTEAAAHFAGALDLEPADGPSLLFAERCQRYAAAGTPPAWDGVHVMQTK